MAPLSHAEEIARKYFVCRRSAGAWEKRWTKSSWKVSEGTAGEWTHTAGKWYGDAEADKGIQTGPDARFYATAAKFDTFSNEGKDLVLQARSGPPCASLSRAVGKGIPWSLIWKVVC